MVQKEVADRICAKEGTPDYGALSAQMQAMGNVRITRKVPRNMFFPSPDVDSAVVRLDIQPICNRALLPHYRKAVAAAFAMRRKTLANNLTAAYSLPKQTAEELVLSVRKSRRSRRNAFARRLRASCRIANKRLSAGGTKTVAALL